MNHRILVVALLSIGRVSPAQEVQVREDTLNCGLETQHLREGLPQALTVEWIRWDSGFRGSGLQVGDQIVAVNDVSIAFPKETRALQIYCSGTIGGLGEPTTWKTQGGKEDTKVKLTVRRRNYGGEGWKSLEIQGVLRNERTYSNSKGRQILGPGGPAGHMEYDGFATSWGSWYEAQVKAWRDALRERLTQTRVALKNHLEESPRLEFLLKQYPGPFAAEAKADWERVKGVLEGKRYDLSPADLEFREIGEKRESEVAEKATRARAAFLERFKKEMIAAFPTIDPIRVDYRGRVGKIVELEPIRNRDWISEATHNYLVKTGEGGGYIVDCESPAAQRMFLAARRYERLVKPNLTPEYSIIGRIQSDPRMLVIGGRVLKGLQLEILGASVGDKMFVDLTRTNGKESLFEGEESLRAPRVPELDAKATPRQVIEAMIVAIKVGDQKAWENLFANWSLALFERGCRYYPYDVTPLDREWISSRAAILGKVCDARIVWVGDVGTVLQPSQFEGAPRIDEIHIELDHIGQFDREYRSFRGIGLNRHWILQRRNAGPWRIVSKQGL